MKYLAKVVIELEYEFEHPDDKCSVSMIEKFESSELEVMLSKDMKDCVYVDNQVARFDEVNVKDIKVVKL